MRRLAGCSKQSRPRGADARTLTRGALAAATGCNSETIRYYEKIGLLAEPPRSSGAQRRYGSEWQRRLHFIRRSRNLGFTIEEVRTLLRLVDGKEVETLARAHLRDIRRNIAELERFERALATMAVRCSGGAVPDCPIIDALLDPELPLAVRGHGTHADAMQRIG